MTHVSSHCFLVTPEKLLACPSQRSEHYIPQWMIALLLLVSFTMIYSGVARANCFEMQALRYTADVRSTLDPALDLALSTGNGKAAAVIGAAIAGTEAGQLIDIGISHWWDPAVEVFPNNPGNIVTPITDAQIFGITNLLLSDITGSTSITLTDLQALNASAPGLGDAAVDYLVTGVRAFAHTLQGAAAFAEDGFGAPSVLSAGALLNADLAAYRNSIQTFAPFLDQLPSPAFPPFTVSQYLAFLTDVQNNGASALPPSEVPVGEQIVTLANVHLQGTTLTDVLVNFISAGDTGNEAALFPAGGFTQRALLESGINNSFNFDPCGCPGCICQTPEPSSLLLFGTGLISLLGYSWRRKKQAA